MESKGRGRIGLSLWLAAAGATVGLATLAGHAQTVLYLVYLGGAYFLVRMPVRQWWRGIWAVMTAAGLSAVQLLPSLQLMSVNHKGKLAFGFAAGGLTPSTFLAILTGNPSGGRILFLGLTPLALALAALLFVRGRPAVFWGLTAIVALLLALGTHGPLFRFFFTYLPGWDLFRDQERACILFVMALTVLAGYGLAWLVGWLKGLRSGRWVYPAVSAAAIALTFGNLYWLNHGNNLWSGPPLRDFQAGDLLKPVLQDTDLFRVRVSERSISHNAGNVLGLQIVSGNSPFELESFKQWTEDGPDGNRVNEWQLMQLTNSHYIVSSRPLCGAGCQASDGIKQIGVSGGLHLFKVLYTLPRAFFVTQTVSVTNERQAIDGINAAGFDPQKTLFLQTPHPRSTPFDPAAKARADVVGYAPGLVDIRATTDRPAYLFTSEIAYPGWEAKIDGQPATIVIADGIFRAVDVPAGSHHIVFQYHPVPFYAGAAISAATLLAFAAAGTWAWLWRRRRSALVGMPSGSGEG